MSFRQLRAAVEHPNGSHSATLARNTAHPSNTPRPLLRARFFAAARKVTDVVWVVFWLSTAYSLLFFGWHMLTQ